MICAYVWHSTVLSGLSKTMPTYCMVCKKEGVKGSVTIHRFPPLSKPEKRQQWLKALNLKSEDIKSHHYVCKSPLQKRRYQQPTITASRKTIRFSEEDANR